MLYSNACANVRYTRKHGANDSSRMHLAALPTVQGDYLVAFTIN
jgi:hypothetical protein